MSSQLHDVHISYTDSALSHDPSLGSALERVFEAQQGLVARRIDLLVEEAAAKLRKLLASSLGATVGTVSALAGWFIAIAGLIDALDDRFPRFALEIGLGLLHIGAGAALI